MKRIYFIINNTPYSGETELPAEQQEQGIWNVEQLKDEEVPAFTITKGSGKILCELPSELDGSKLFLISTDGSTAVTRNGNSIEIADVVLEDLRIVVDVI